VTHRGAHEIEYAVNSCWHQSSAIGLGASSRRMSRTLLIVDDHAAFRASARALLESDGFEIVGEAADGRSALLAAATLRPDVVLLDIALPDLDGFAVAEQLHAEPNAPAIVLVSSRERSAYGHRIHDAPVRGFLAKRELSGAALLALL
jgi:DNA-binding NarL/FixJ family response regulator